MSGKEDAALKLGRIADALVEDLARMPDGEFLAECQEAGLDPAALAKEARSAVADAIAKAGKQRMAAARAGAARSAARPAAGVVLLPLAEKRRIVERFAANDTGLQAKLTLAARKGEGESEVDIDSFLRALVELGVIDADGRPK